MYAVIKAGGKQQRVRPGDIIEVEYVHGAGETVTFQPLLVVDDEGNAHYGREAERAVVTAKPVGEQKGDKVHVVKYKNKTGYARHTGHRQTMTLLEIADVSLGVTAKKAAPKRAAKAAPEAEEAEAPAAAVAEEAAEDSEE